MEKAAANQPWFLLEQIFRFLFLRTQFSLFRRECLSGGFWLFWNGREISILREQRNRREN